MCFFFQAEDGIRDYKVTGVQTCALPIFGAEGGGVELAVVGGGGRLVLHGPGLGVPQAEGAVGAGAGEARAVGREAKRSRSEERRVGKEGRYRWTPYH